MLSYLLSKIFKALFVIYFIAALGQIYSQINLKPFTIKLNENSFFSISEPGLNVLAKRQNNVETNGPDTVILVTSKASGSVPQVVGKYRLAVDNFDGTSLFKKTNWLEEYKKNPGNIFDTAFTLITYQEQNQIEYNSTSAETLNDGSIIYNESKNGKKIVNDTFANMRKFMQEYVHRKFKSDNKIYEVENGLENLRILPANNKEHIWFVLLSFFSITFVLLLLYTLGKLFTNFYREQYFLHSNVLLLRKIGYYILGPQILLSIFYWTFLANMRPVKISGGFKNFGDYKTIAQFEMQSSVEVNMIILGLGIIILSYIFKNGLKLKEEQDLTI